MKASAVKVCAIGILATAATIAVPATPVWAQVPGMNLASPVNKPLTEEEVKAREERESAYKSAISKVPSQKPANDPWGNIRGAGAAQNKQVGARNGAK